VAAAAVPAAARVSAAFVTAAFVTAFGGPLVATFVATFKAAFAAALEAACGAVFMEGPVEASIGEVSLKEDAVAATVIAAGRPVIRTAACQCHARSDQASNDRLTAIRCHPPGDAAPVRGGGSRFRKLAFHH
jgi:hypothetical protein